MDDPSLNAPHIREPLSRRRLIPRLSSLEGTVHALSPGDRLVLLVLSTIFILSTLALVALANAAVSTEIPTRGGSLVEGVVGPVRFLNPLLALSEPDKDIAALVYSGLMRATPEGTLIPDLARNVEISEDGTVYTFILRSGLTFHDGERVTSDDVLFTIQRAQNPDIKSPRRADWEGVTVTTPDEETVVFTLPHAYAPFLENATVGILPEHRWHVVTPEEFPFAPLNTDPVGSGPYRIKKFDTDATGSATRYELAPFKDFALGTAYLSNITFNFYSNDVDLVDAYNRGRIDAIAGISPSLVEEVAESGSSIINVPLPRTFGIFFNQNNNTALAEAGVRAALDTALDKQVIVDEILEGYGAALDGPIPPGLLGPASPKAPSPIVRMPSRESSAEPIEAARDILARSGWTFDEETGTWSKKDVVLSLTLATPDEAELARTAEAVAAAWREVGVEVDVHIYPISELNAVVLRPRDYEAILFGEVVGRTLDLFAFWHSSQRNDPGLNIALYTNARADNLLATARATTNEREREALYEEFEEIVAEDRPAVFLYSPDFIYIVPERLKGIALGALTQPSDRFLSSHQWYTDTEHVWNIFTNKTEISL